MEDSAGVEYGSKGLSAGQLVLVFLAGVAVCAIFFALGFIVGYNQRPARVAAETERISGPSVVPTPVSSPPPSAATAGGAQGGVSQPGASSHAPSPATDKAVPVPSAAATSAAPAGAVTPAEPDASGSAKSAAEAGGPLPPGAIVLQVAATSTRGGAESLVTLLKGRGYSAFLVTPESGRAGDTLFRVQIGPFRSRAEAERSRRKLVSEGFKPLIKR